MNLEDSGGHRDGALLVCSKDFGAYAGPRGTDDGFYVGIPGSNSPAIIGRPGGSEAPEVANDVFPTTFGADRLGVILHGPKWFGAVLACHDDTAVLFAVVRPAEWDDVGLLWEVDMERVVAYSTDLAYTVENLRA